MSETDRAAVAAHNLADAIHDDVAGIAYTPLTTISDAADEIREVLSGQGESRHPVTMIEERIAHAAWVLRELVSITGFQAELVVYGGDFGEVGTSIHRDVRISIRREQFDTEHLKALTRFAEDHVCSLVVDHHGATLRIRAGRDLAVEVEDGLEVNAVTTGAANGKGSANSSHGVSEVSISGPSIQ